MPLVIDLKDRAAFDTQLHSRTHSGIAEKAGEAFDMQSADIAQIEYNP